MRKGELVPLILTVCPNIKEQPGKVTLISRFGADNVETMLPAFIKEVQVSEMNVHTDPAACIWSENACWRAFLLPVRDGGVLDRVC